jgi:hypothetical protein
MTKKLAALTCLVLLLATGSAHANALFWFMLGAGSASNNSAPSSSSSCYVSSRIDSIQVQYTNTYQQVFSSYWCHDEDHGNNPAFVSCNRQSSGIQDFLKSKGLAVADADCSGLSRCNGDRGDSGSDVTLKIQLLDQISVLRIPRDSDNYKTVCEQWESKVKSFKSGIGVSCTSDEADVVFAGTLNVYRKTIEKYGYRCNGWDSEMPKNCLAEKSRIEAILKSQGRDIVYSECTRTDCYHRDGDSGPGELLIISH